MSKRLPREFYLRSDTIQIAKDLIGKLLVVPTEAGERVSGMIVETEAYLGVALPRQYKAEMLDPRVSRMHSHPKIGLLTASSNLVLRPFKDQTRFGEGRISKELLENFRHELAAGGEQDRGKGGHSPF